MCALLVHFFDYLFSLFPRPIDNVYVADKDNHRIRKVTVATSIITTIAGSSTSGSYTGDNGPATSAGLNHPYGVAVDASGRIIIRVCCIVTSCFVHYVILFIY